MTRDDIGQRAAQRIDVERARELHGHRDVVGRLVALELRQEPEPLLSERGGQIAVARHRLDRDRRRRRRSLTGIASRGESLEILGQQLHRRQAQTELLLDGEDDLHRE